MNEERLTTFKEEARDRARGALLGLAVGDAVGTAHHVPKNGAPPHVP